MTGKDRERILALKKKQQEEMDALKKKIRDEEEENRRKKAMEKTMQECRSKWGDKLVGLLIETRGKDNWYSSPAEEMEAEVDTLLKSGLVYVEFLKTLFGDRWREIEHPDMLLKKFTNMHRPGEEQNGTMFRNLRQRWETTDEFKELKRQDEARARQKAIEDERKAAAKARRKERRDAAKQKEDPSAFVYGSNT